MKHVLIGGSGTLGKCMTEKLITMCPTAKVVCFSRGEHQQKELKARFPEVETIIGDVRDRRAVRRAVQGATFVYLLAAIKHIDVAEQNPLEAIKTNVLGAVNVAEESINAHVSRVIYSNTDKAVLPITTYGYTKAIAQNYLLAQNGKSGTKFCAFNWGNIIASQGSAVPIFVDAMTRTGVVPITDPRMSRFWITIDEAASFLLFANHKAPADKAMIPAIKGATVVRVIDTISRILGIPYKLEVIGLRGVEKLYEVLSSTHDGCLRSDTCEQYTDEELTALLEPVVRSQCLKGR